MKKSFKSKLFEKKNRKNLSQKKEVETSKYIYKNHSHYVTSLNLSLYFSLINNIEISSVSPFFQITPCYEAPSAGRKSTILIQRSFLETEMQYIKRQIDLFMSTIYIFIEIRQEGETEI